MRVGAANAMIARTPGERSANLDGIKRRMAIS
jgi:hypothetical protein